VLAVVLNVTVTDVTGAPSFLTVFPTGTSRPNASNLNFNSGQTVANLVETVLSPDGRVTIYNNVAIIDVVVDVEGYYTSDQASSPGLFRGLVPSRILDTRANSRTGTCASSCATLGPASSIDLQVAGEGGVPGTGATAIVMNLTGTNASGPETFLTAYPSGQNRPNASNLNFGTGKTVPNRVVVPLGSGGRLTIYNNAGSADVILDVNGYYTGSSGSGSGGLYTPLAPSRILDTRNGTGAYSGTGGPGGQILLTVAGQGGVPPSGASAVILNVTAANHAGPASFLTVYPSGAARPNASDLNYEQGDTFANLVVVQVAADGTIDLYNNLGGTEVVADVYGYYH
jgi:hypothetical protein